MINRRDFTEKTLLSIPLLFGMGGSAFANTSHFFGSEDVDPTDCNYAPPGEYIKDHSFVFHDGWYHLFSISGTQGYYHGYNGNEETVSWSVSKDLVNWEMRGHVLHATQIKGAFDQQEIWAPFCFKGKDQFYMFYTGIIHPTRPMEYKKLGHDHPWVYDGHKETQGLAVSKDLTYWDKVSDFSKGIGIPGRDSFVMYDADKDRYLLYSTIGNHEVHIAESKDIINWKAIGICAKFPVIEGNNGPAESLTIMKHPLTGKWIMLANHHYLISDDLLKFDGTKVKKYDTNFMGKQLDIGFAAETFEYKGKWYRSGCIGKRDYWKLGFTEIEWVKDGAFKIIKPSKLAILE